MNVYLDLSFFVNLITHALCLFYLYLMYELKNKLYKNILIIFFLSIIVFTLPLFTINSIVIYLIYDILILSVFLPKKKKFFLIFTYLSIYYILIALAQLINKGIIVKGQILIINKPLSTLSIFTLFIPIIFIYLFSYLLRKEILIMHYKCYAYLKINGHIYKLKGYLDSGNTLLSNGKPVVFIKENILKYEKLKNGEIIKYYTLNNSYREEVGYEGEMIIKYNFKKIYKKIIFSLVSDDYYFNNCDCLLNAYCR